MNLSIDRVESPIGTLLVVSSGTALVAVDFADCEDRMLGLLRGRFNDVDLVEAASEVSSRLSAYFAGDLAALGGIAVDGGGTPFQRDVWRVLQTIPIGGTISYRELALQLGKRDAVRAVGFANSRNPIAIVVPCHRVIGSDGSLVGYAGGLERKRWLLAHEGVTVQSRLV